MRLEIPLGPEKRPALSDPWIVILIGWVEQRARQAREIIARASVLPWRGDMLVAPKLDQPGKFLHHQGLDPGILDDRDQRLLPLVGNRIGKRLLGMHDVSRGMDSRRAIDFDTRNFFCLIVIEARQVYRIPFYVGAVFLEMKKILLHRLDHEVPAAHRMKIDRKATVHIGEQDLRPMLSLMVRLAKIPLQAMRYAVEGGFHLPSLCFPKKVTTAASSASRMSGSSVIGATNATRHARLVSTPLAIKVPA